MKYFMIEGTIIHADKMHDAILKEHMAYTQKAMDAGMIFLSGLKDDASGAIFFMKAESAEIIQDYLDEEPFYRYGIQTYRTIPFTYHFIQEMGNDWFS